MMMYLEDAIRAKEVINALVDQVASRKHTILLSTSMNGDKSYSVHLQTNEVVYVFKKGFGFFSKYETWYDGISLEIQQMDSRRLYQTMSQVYRQQERVKSEMKLEKLESFIRVHENQ